MKCSRCGGPILGGICLHCGQEVDLAKELASKLGFKGDLDELAVGIKEEYKEHAKTLNHSYFLAASIAIDHLNEDPHYYTKLKKMEAKK